MTFTDGCYRYRILVQKHHQSSCRERLQHFFDVHPGHGGNSPQLELLARLHHHSTKIKALGAIENKILENGDVPLVYLIPDMQNAIFAGLLCARVRQGRTVRLHHGAGVLD